MSDTLTTDTPEAVEAVSEAQEAVQPTTEADPAPADVEAEPDTYPAEHVAELRDELAKKRIRIKETTGQANARLLAAYLAADGRVVPEARDLIALTEDLIGEDGFVDGDRVTEAVGAFLASRPFAASRTPTTPLPMGVQATAPTEVGWLAVLRGEAR
jgi:hypothetical protein